MKFSINIKQFKIMLQSVNYGLIESNQLLTLGKSVIGVFSTFDPKNDPHVLAPFVSLCTNGYKLYSQAYEREHKNPFTQELLKGDKRRDCSFWGYRDYVSSCTNSEEDNIKDAAIRLLNIIIKHGWGAAYFGYKAQTAALTKIINETRDFYMSDVELIAAKTRFDLMVTRQEDFEELQKSSVTRPPSNLPTLVEARPKLIDGLRKLLTMVDNHYSTSPTDVVLAGYVKALNELIVLTMTTARAAQTRDENKKKNDESDNASAT